MSTMPISSRAQSGALGKAGEKFVGLDGKEYSVDETMCVIADDTGPLGLGGVMGGEALGLDGRTDKRLHRERVVRSPQNGCHGPQDRSQTDARYRFERGVDPASVRARARSRDGHDPESLRRRSHRKPRSPAKSRSSARHPVRFRPRRKAPASNVPMPKSRRPLKALGFKIDGKPNAAKVTVPTWRPDIHGSADLVEEVVRIAGSTVCPRRLCRAPTASRAPCSPKSRSGARRARRLLAAAAASSKP